MTRDELCLTVPAHRTTKVANYKSVPVTVYDYYNRLESARMMYEPRQSQICEICTDDDCQECKIKSGNLEKSSRSSGCVISTSYNLLIIGALFFYIYTKL